MIGDGSRVVGKRGSPSVRNSSYRDEVNIHMYFIFMKKFALLRGAFMHFNYVFCTILYVILES